MNPLSKQNHSSILKVIFFLTILLMPVCAFCGQVTLAWTQNTEPDIAGYRIFCRQENNTYTFTRPLWEGLGTKLIVKDLDDGKSYYFRVRSYNKSGIASVNSNEVHYRTPDNPTLPSYPDQNPIPPVNDSDSIPQDSNTSYEEDSITSDLMVGSSPDRLNSENYQVARLGSGERYYLDRTYILTSVPTGLSTGTEEWIKTKNNDKNQNSEVFLTFTISRNATVYVCYDSRATSLPDWLSGTYEPTAMKIGVSEGMGHFNVYQQDFSAGTISMGGNLASGAGNVFSNYIVIIQPEISDHEIVDISKVAFYQDDSEADSNIIQSVQDNIKSVMLEDGQNMTVESSEGTKISKLEIKEKPSSSDIPSDDLEFTYGLVDLTIENVDAGGSAIVKLYLPEGSSPETYYKYGPTPDQPEDHWYEFMYDGETGAEIDQNVITLHYVDGKRGDDNLTEEDDKITDINGGAVFRSSQAIQSDSTSMNSDSNSGCFVQCLSFQ